MLSDQIYGAASVFLIIEVLSANKPRAETGERKYRSRERVVDVNWARSPSGDCQDASRADGSTMFESIQFPCARLIEHLKGFL